MPIQHLRESCFNATEFSQEILNWIEKENAWNIWVPKEFGGLELSLSDGLQKLKELAQIDGSLGWTVTLCSGANFFIGNLRQEVAEELFLGTKEPVVLGGSGGVFGTAKKQGNHYILNGKWRYATGAPYLSHFTLNAQIIEDGKALKNNDGTPYFRSFIIPKEKVRIEKDWDTMGLEASVTHSFHVESVTCDSRYSFLYTDVYLPHSIYKIPFLLFADLTLWVNYIGMAAHLLEEIANEVPKEKYTALQEICSFANQQLTTIAAETEGKLNENRTINKNYIQQVHTDASESVRNLSQAIIKLHPFLGIKASRKSHPINQIFRDYFTATQHHIFVDWS